MVYRVYVEKKQGLQNEAKNLLADAKTLLQIEGLRNIRIFNRYDVENISEELFEKAIRNVFSEPQLDNVTYHLETDGADNVFAVEYLPGQYDQRADSAAQCIAIISRKEKPDVKTAKVYALYGTLSDSDVEQLKKYVINPVESREAALEKPETLAQKVDIPDSIKVLDGFNSLDSKGLEDFVIKQGLAMDNDDIKFCQDYFKSEGREPTITEIKMIDTYWSDHCRHTTFLTTIDSVTFEDKLLQSAFEEYMEAREEINRNKPINLMDIGTIGAKLLKSRGLLPKIDESEEINACTVKIDVNVEGETQKWLLLFKNETHNHPTEIEPFGGAATCIGGAIRDPLSGRAYVYGAMRITGAGDPLVPVKDTIEGKLPQRKIVTTAAAGYSSYGNQIGLATGQVDEIYHPGYVAKRMEIGAVVGAVPQENVRRECPVPGDVIILLGGRTGRDGCGGATGSSKSHNLESLESCGAEVQKGNAPQERKLQRLFRNKEASLMIKRCNDFGAGGVSVAIGELADGIEIDLNAVPRKYEGLDGTELAISESQERMAVVVEPKDVDRFKEIADSENLEATVVAYVKADPRLTMSWNGVNIVDISRDFLNSNGAQKHIDITPANPEKFDRVVEGGFADNFLKFADDLNICSKRGLSERFDSTIGAGTVMMPFGGKYQLTPSLAMVNKISVEDKDTDTCSLMAWGYNPYIMEKSPYHGAYLAVVESLCKLVSTGATLEETYLTFQEYFEKPMKDGKRWGKPLSALLGAFKAQKDFSIASIGGKDSMSGSFEDIDVPPTLVSFAVTTACTDDIISPEFKGANHKVVIIRPKYDENSLPVAESLLSNCKFVNELIKSKKALSVYTLGYGGIAESVLKMCLGNKIGFKFGDDVSISDIFSYGYGTFVVELSAETDAGDFELLGETVSDYFVSLRDEKVSMEKAQSVWENKLESVYSCNIKTSEEKPPVFSFENKEYSSVRIKCAKPKILIPVFPGTNCEYDTAKVLRRAGGEPEIMVINNLTASGINSSVERFAKSLADSQIVFIPGGFSGGDEPDGSGKFITAFFRNPEIKEGVHELLQNRDGLMCGICNGFQALVKLGLVPFGEIIDTDENCPTLTFNTINRHQSRLVRTRIASNKSPWLSSTNVGDIFTVPISHGEGKFLCSEELVKKLAENGQIATQYVDSNGEPTYDIRYNPNGSVCAIEGITSPDGRVFGKMGHSERIGNGLYKNVDGNYDMKMFESAVKYFK